MNVQNYYLFVFESKNHAVLLYTILESKQNNVAQLVSTPCSLKSGCTYSLKVTHEKYLESIAKEAEEVGIKKYRIYHVQRINGKLKYKEI